MPRGEVVQAELHVKQQGKEILGLYVANERIGDLAVPLGLSKVADTIKRENPKAVVLMVRLSSSCLQRRQGLTSEFVTDRQ